jgi:hypothetical protein
VSVHPCISRARTNDSTEASASVFQ